MYYYSRTYEVNFRKCCYKISRSKFGTLKWCYWFPNSWNFNKNVTSNKTKHVLVWNKLNELLKTVEAISTKGLTKDLINKNNILNGVIIYYSHQIRYTLNILMALIEKIRLVPLVEI